MRVDKTVCETEHNQVLKHSCNTITTETINTPRFAADL